MSPFLAYGLAGAVLFGIALHGAVARPGLLRKILAVNVLSMAIFLLLGAFAHRDRAGVADPVPHAMVLTGIVVAVSVTAFALALARRLARVRRDPALLDRGGGP